MSQRKEKLKTESSSCASVVPPLQGDIIMNMKLYKKVFDLLRSGVSVPQILEELRIPPSRLRRIMQSKRFIEHMELQREATRAFMALTTADQAFWIVRRLRELSEGRNEDSARKVCYALLNTLLDGHHGRPLSSTTPNVHTPEDLPADIITASTNANPKPPRADTKTLDKKRKQRVPISVAVIPTP
jgi:hypothetical protein